MCAHTRLREERERESQFKESEKKKVKARKEREREREEREIFEKSEREMGKEEDARYFPRAEFETKRNALLFLKEKERKNERVHRHNHREFVPARRCLRSSRV